MEKRQVDIRSELRDCLNMQWKILSFTASRDDLLSLNRSHLVWGLVWAWVAGIGRAWDNGLANVVMRSGLPSVAYVFVLSAFLFLFIIPLRPHNWSYKRLLTFISLTALPGVMYAIPLEMMLPPTAAADGNGLLLLIVATWRVAMLGFFLGKTTDFDRLRSAVALLLPLSIVVNVLIMTEQFEKTFAVMGGIRYLVKTGENVTPKQLQDDAYNHLEPLKDTTGRAKGTVYRYFYMGGSGTVPAGYREIQWDDADYLPPSLLMSVLRPLGKISQYAAPVLMLLYVMLCIKASVAATRKNEQPVEG
jgi:hypothetical protein